MQGMSVMELNSQLNAVFPSSSPLSSNLHYTTAPEINKSTLTLYPWLTIPVTPTGLGDLLPALFPQFLQHALI
jgi:hypothetical protein